MRIKTVSPSTMICGHRCFLLLLEHACMPLPCITIIIIQSCMYGYMVVGQLGGPKQFVPSLSAISLVRSLVTQLDLAQTGTWTQAQVSTNASSVRTLGMWGLKSTGLMWIQDDCNTWYNQVSLPSYSHWTIAVFVSSTRARNVWRRQTLLSQQRGVTKAKVYVLIFISWVIVGNSYFHFSGKWYSLRQRM